MQCGTVKDNSKKRLLVLEQSRWPLRTDYDCRTTPYPLSQLYLIWARYGFIMCSFQHGLSATVTGVNSHCWSDFRQYFSSQETRPEMRINGKGEWNGTCGNDQKCEFVEYLDLNGLSSGVTMIWCEKIFVHMCACNLFGYFLCCRIHLTNIIVCLFLLSS